MKHSNSTLKKPAALLCERISIFDFKDDYIINKDGSIAVGFELTLLEEETIDGDRFTSIIDQFSAAARRLPVATYIQKLDVYEQAPVCIDTPDNLPFFYQKALLHHQHKTRLKHRSFLFLNFFSMTINPLGQFIHIGTFFFNPAKVSNSFFQRKEEVDRACQEFLASLPSDLQVKKLNEKENKRILYQYANLTFNREPTCFEQDYTILKDSIQGNGFVKIIRMQRQPQHVFDWSRNNLGSQGVTSPFMWPLTHYAYFPHIISQQIEIISDQKFRKNKNWELSFSSQMALGARGRELSEYVHESFVELEKELEENQTQIVNLHYSVLIWNHDKDKMNAQADYIKSAFGKVGIDAYEEGENTCSSFFATMPGGTGFLESAPMPLETAVAHLNFVTPKKGDREGIILCNRHGEPVCYDPFKYSLDNQHAFVFGPSGSGKSFFNGKMIKDRYYAGHTVIVIDSGGTYRFLFEALGGTYIEYKPDRPLKFNPFLFKKKEDKYHPSPDKIAFLINFIAKIWKGDLTKNPLSEVEYALFSKFLTTYYESLLARDIPTLSGFCSWLKGHVAREGIEAGLFNIKHFLLILEPFTEGIYKEHFNALQIEHPEDSRLICFELEAVKSDSKLYPLVVKVLFDYVLQLVELQPDQKKFIDIEEGWTMLDDSSKDYIEGFFRKGRKTNTSIRIITQNVDEIKNSPIAGAMKNNASTFILLYNDKESVRNDIADFLGMNEFDKEKYASLRRRDSYLDGYREVFIKEMDTSSVWRVETSLFEHAILTSRPDERNAITKLKKIKGDLEMAVTNWVENIHQKS